MFPLLIPLEVADVVVAHDRAIVARYLDELFGSVGPEQLQSSICLITLESVSPVVIQQYAFLPSTHLVNRLWVDVHVSQDVLVVDEIGHRMCS